MQVDLVQDTGQLAELGPAWQQLEQEMDAARGLPYYVRHRFVSAWWQAHASQTGLELAVLVLRQDGGQVVGIAPLALSRGKAGVQLRFASHGDYFGFLIDPQARADTVCKKLLAAAHELNWDTLRLGNVPADSPLAAYLFKSEYNQQFTLHVENPYIDLRKYADFSDYTAAQLPSHVRKQRRRLLAEHDLTFQVVEGDDGGLFDRIGEVHRAERDFLVSERGRTERHSFFDSAARREHYRTIFTSTDDPVTFVLRAADDSLAGYRTAFRDGRKLLSWNSAYHPDFADHRIGSVLLHDMLEHLFGTSEADILDLGAGRYPWKFGWTGDFTATYRLRLSRTAKSPTTSPGAQSTAAPSPQHPAKQLDVKQSDVKHTNVIRPEAKLSPAARSAPPAHSKAANSKAADNRSVELVRAGRGKARRLAGRVVRSVTRKPPPPRRRTTYVIAPHPDDETLRATGYITWLRGRRDNRFVLVAVSDGGNSSLSRRRGWTPEQEQAYRRTEQAAAWAAMTGGEGEIVRLGIPDGGITAEAVVRAVHARLPEILGPGVEVVVACHMDDYHADHQAVAQAFRELAPRRLSFSLAPLMKSPRNPDHLLREVAPSAQSLAAAQIAHDAYAGFGQRSVRKEFASLVTQGFRSRLTSPDQRPSPASADLGDTIPRILLLGSRFDLLPEEVPPLPERSTTRHLIRAAGADRKAQLSTDDPTVQPLVPDPPRGRRAQARDLLTETIHRIIPNSTPPGLAWSQTLATSSRARVLIGDADALVSADAATDEALELLPELVQDRPVTPSSRARAALLALEDLEALLTEVTDSRRASRLTDEIEFSAQLRGWSVRAGTVGSALEKDRHLSTAWSRVEPRVWEVHGELKAARIVADVLAKLP